MTVGADRTRTAGAWRAGVARRPDQHDRGEIKTVPNRHAAEAGGGARPINAEPAGGERLVDDSRHHGLNGAADIWKSGHDTRDDFTSVDHPSNHAQRSAASVRPERDAKLRSLNAQVEPPTRIDSQGESNGHRLRGPHDESAARDSAAHDGCRIRHKIRAAGKQRIPRWRKLRGAPVERTAVRLDRVRRVHSHLDVIIDVETVDVGYAQHDRYRASPDAS